MDFFKNHNKIPILFCLMFIFSIIYMLLDDSHFAGVNKFKETLQDGVLKNKAKREIKENFDNRYEDKEMIIDNVTRETKIQANEDLHPTKVQPSMIYKYINRLYFAIVTGCLLGYGDVYPVSNICKIFTSMQGLLTVSLIIY